MQVEANNKGELELAFEDIDGMYKKIGEFKDYPGIEAWHYSGNYWMNKTEIENISVLLCIFINLYLK